MARAYNAGTAHVDIKPNLGDFAAELKRKLKALNPEILVTVKPDGKRFAAELKAMLAAVPDKIDIDVGLNTAQATAEIQALSAAAKDITVDMDVDTGKAKAKIEEFDGTITMTMDTDITGAIAQVKGAAANETATIDLDLDTKDADAKMTAFQRVKTFKIKVDVDTRKAEAKLNSLRSTGVRGGGAGQMMMLGAGLAGLATAAAGVIGPLAAMSKVALTAANSLWVLPAAAGAAGAGIASLMTGLSGVGGAFGAMGKSAGGGAAATEKSMKAAQRAVEAAERGVERAYRGIEDAYRGIEDAVRGVRDAEEDLADAQYESAKAQAEVDAARKDAVRNLQDMNEQLRDAAMDEEGAVLAVARAKERLQKALADGDSSGLDIAEADLGYRRAVESLDDMRKKNDELAASVAAGNTAGVEGSNEVVEAKEKVVEKQRAEEDAAERVELAQRDVADAYRDLADAQQDLEDAQKRLADAIADMNDKMNGGGGGGIDQFAEAMAKLSPNARDFVLAVRALGDEWRDVKLAAQDALFNGLGAAITTLAHAQLPTLKEGFVGINTEINSGIRESWAAFSTEVAVADFDTFLTNTTSLFKGLGESMEPLSQIWMDIATVGSEFFPAMGEAISGTMHDWATRVNELRESGELKQIIQDGIDAAQLLGSVISTVWGIFSNVMAAADAAGQPFLGTLNDVATRWEAWTGSSEGQNMMVDFFTSASNALGNLYPALAGFGTLFATGIVPFFEKLTEGAGPGLAKMFESLTNAMITMNPSADNIGEAIGRIAEVFGKVIEILSPVINLFNTFAADLIGFLAPILVPIVMGFMAIAAVAAPLGIFAGVVLKVIGVVKVLASAGGMVSGVFKIIFALFRAHPIMMVITAIGLLITGLIYAYNNSETFRNIVNKIGEYLKIGFIVAVDAARNIMIKLGEKVVDLANWFREFKATAKETMDGAIEATGKFFSSMAELPGKLGKVFQDSASWLVNAGRNLISGLWDGAKDMWGNFTNWLSESVNPLANGRTSRNALGSVSTNSRGSVSHFAAGGISSFATGGEDHSPQYAPAGAWRVWAEPETGGELYIPLANDHRRGRAEALLTAGAHHFGLEVIDPKTRQPVTPDYQGNLQPNTQFFAEGGVSGTELEDFARGVQGKPYDWGGVNWGDCSGTQAALANFATGRAPFASRFATMNQREELLNRGFTMGDGGPGAFTIGWWNGGAGGGHTASTLPTGINVEMRGGDGGVFGGSAIGASDGRHQQRAHLPANWFKQISIPVDAFGDYDFTKEVGTVRNPGAASLSDSVANGAGDSGVDLLNFRNSDAANPDAYSTDNKTPTTWSGIAKNFASLWVEGQTKDTLSAFGISDEIPPIMQAAQSYNEAVDRADNAISGRAKTAAIDGIEAAAANAIKADPTMPTIDIPGSAFVIDDKSFADAPPLTKDEGDINQQWDPDLGAAQWRTMMKSAYLHQGYEPTDAKIDAWVRQIQSESGGNPNIAQQIVDVNGTGEAAGVGLGQMIPTTWQAYRDPSLPDDRRNPWAMTNAMVRYGERKYGAKLLDVIGHGHGYATGGDVWGAGGPTDDAIFARLSNGEHVTKTASASVARPLLHAINDSPRVAAQLNSAFTSVPRSPGNTAPPQVNITYEITTTDLGEAMRRAEMQGNRALSSMKIR